MAGGKATTKKDESIKVTAGQAVKTSQILVRGVNRYKAGVNVKGMGSVHALCAGTVYFTKKKTPGGKIMTFINVKPFEK